MVLQSLAQGQGPGKKALYGSVCLLFALCIISGRFTVAPKRCYDLGPTALLADWEEAYRWVLKDWKEDPNATALISYSPFPMFHDIYLDEYPGTNYFLPFSISGAPGSIRKTARYSDAKSINDLSQILWSGGYVVSDGFGLRMLSNQEIQKYLRLHPPTRVIPGQGHFPLFVWKVRNG